MPDLNELIGHWGYLAIFLVVVLGNLGIPVLEEAILVLAGYLVWEGQLWLRLGWRAFRARASSPPRRR